MNTTKMSNEAVTFEDGYQIAARVEQRLRAAFPKYPYEIAAVGLHANGDVIIDLGEAYDDEGDKRVHVSIHDMPVPAIEDALYTVASEYMAGALNHDL